MAFPCSFRDSQSPLHLPVFQSFWKSSCSFYLFYFILNWVCLLTYDCTEQNMQDVISGFWETLKDYYLIYDKKKIKSWLISLRRYSSDWQKQKTTTTYNYSCMRTSCLAPVNCSFCLILYRLNELLIVKTNMSVCSVCLMHDYMGPLYITCDVDVIYYGRTGLLQQGWKAESSIYQVCGADKGGTPCGFQLGSCTHSLVVTSCLCYTVPDNSLVALLCSWLILCHHVQWVEWQ